MSVEASGRLLAERDFRRWFVSRSTSFAGTVASAVALPLLTYQTSDSPALTAAVVGLEALPYLLFGLFAGAAADRLRRKAMMVSADIACAALLATVPLAHALGVLTVGHVLAVAFGVGCGFCWFDSAAWGALARLVGKPRLPAANSLIWSTEIVLAIAVPAAAGLLASLADPAVVLAGDAATYLVSAALLVRIGTDLDPPVRAESHVRADIAEGLRFLWRQPVIRTMSLTGFGLNLAGGGASGLLVVHADKVLGLSSPDRRVGLLYSAAAVGGLAAAVLLPRAARTLGAGKVSIVAYALFVLALLGLAVTPVFAGALLLWAAWELGRGAGNMNGITVRQQLTPDELQGRVNTTGRMISWGGTPFGALVGGGVAELAGVRAAYVVLAVPVAVGLVALVASPVRRLRVPAG
ncbi:MFS transporter [Phytohabitans sp. LJ34]|uniref:MFS transporter n=1 Tax=Phytohabitans sp. LJ34 TaxID=3452217 RepID=UPI003F8C308A